MTNTNINNLSITVCEYCGYYKHRGCVNANCWINTELNIDFNLKIK